MVEQEQGRPFTNLGQMGQPNVTCHDGVGLEGSIFTTLGAVKPTGTRNRPGGSLRTHHTNRKTEAPRDTGDIQVNSKPTKPPRTVLPKKPKLLGG